MFTYQLYFSSMQLSQLWPYIFIYFLGHKQAFLIGQILRSKNTILQYNLLLEDVMSQMQLQN